MRTAATIAIVNTFVRLFPAPSLQAKLLKQVALCSGAILFVWLMSLTRGVDLSYAFF